MHLPLYNATWTTIPLTTMMAVISFVFAHLLWYTWWSAMRTSTRSTLRMSCLILYHISTQLFCTYRKAWQRRVLCLKEPRNLPPAPHAFHPSNPFKSTAGRRCAICQIQRQPRCTPKYPRLKYVPSHTCRDIWLTGDQIANVQHPVWNLSQAWSRKCDDSCRIRALKDCSREQDDLFCSHGFEHCRGFSSITEVSTVTEPFEPIDVLHRGEKKPVSGDVC